MRQHSGRGPERKRAKLPTRAAAVPSKNKTYVRTLGVAAQSGGDIHQFYHPRGVCVEPGRDGCLYVSDCGNNRVLVFLKA